MNLSATAHFLDASNFFFFLLTAILAAEAPAKGASALLYLDLKLGLKHAFPPHCVGQHISEAAQSLWLRQRSGQCDAECEDQ